MNEDAEADAEVAKAEQKREEEISRLNETKVTSFKENSAFEESSGGLFPDERNREQVEHNYGFSGQKIEEYSAVLENKLDSLHSIDEQAKKQAQ